MAKEEGDGPAPSLGLLSIVSAVLNNRVSVEAATLLAQAVLFRIGQEADSKADLHAPREAESIAASWNRHMDAVLDAAAESAGKRLRSTRRAMMAAALDKADLMLMERSSVAAIYERLVKLDEAA